MARATATRINVAPCHGCSHAAKAAPAAPRKLVEREAERLQQAVDAARGNLSRAAADLGIARSTLYRRLRRHGLVA